MLNAKKLSELLAKNVDPKLYPRMFIMSPNGTLLAYSTPVDIKELRDQAALISMAWKEQDSALKAKAGKAGSATEGSQQGGSASASQLETLTIEFENNNLLVRAVQPKLLLVLVGGVPPGRKHTFRMTAEAHGDPRYPSGSSFTSPHGSIDATINTGQRENGTPTNGNTSVAGSPTPSIPESHMSQREKDVKQGVLHIQRKKLDVMTNVIRADFDSKGFVMPDDSVFS